MEFMNADNDRTPNQLTDVNAMESVGSSRDVNIVIQIETDRHQTARYRLEKNNQPFNIKRRPRKDDLPIITSPPLQNLGTIDATSPREIADFVAWTKNNFPARHYALILRDHGFGWRGFGRDDYEKTQGSYKKLKEIAALVKSSLGERLDLIGFDACDMATVEVAYLYSDVGRSMVASEETERPVWHDGSNWAYLDIMRDLVDHPSMDGRALASSVVLNTAARNRNPRFTYSAVDLDRVPLLVKAFGELIVRRLPRLNEEFEDALVARRLATFIGKKAPGSAVDLGNWLLRLSERVTDPKIAAARAALRDAVIISRSGPARRDAEGLSLFMPVKKRGNLIFKGQDYEPVDFARDTGWSRYLKGFLVKLPR